MFFLSVNVQLMQLDFIVLFYVVIVYVQRQLNPQLSVLQHPQLSVLQHPQQQLLAIAVAVRVLIN
jgi:hypothetical protein